MKHEHYFKNVKNYEYIDVYRVLKLFEVNDPCIQHAVKKLLAAGARGVKPMEKDIQEAIDSLIRWKTMYSEDDTRYNIHSMMNEVTDKKCCRSCDNSKIKSDDVLTLTNWDDTMINSINISEVGDIKTVNLGFYDPSHDWNRDIWGMGDVNEIQPLKIDTIKL